jgi:hypothetical protein
MLQKHTVPPGLWNTLVNLQGSEQFKDFVLVGGTALSLQIGHRQSVDIDLFTQSAFDKNEILTYLESHYKNQYHEFFNADKIFQFTIDTPEEENIKVDLVHYDAPHIEPPRTEESITYLGIKDIAAMKLRVMANGKHRAKDYIDMCYILAHISLDEVFESFKKKYGGTDITHIKKALSESNLVNPYEWEKIKMIKNDFFISDVGDILASEIKTYNKIHKIKNPGKSWFWER